MQPDSDDACPSAVDSVGGSNGVAAAIFLKQWYLNDVIFDFFLLINFMFGLVFLSRSHIFDSIFHGKRPLKSAYFFNSDLLCVVFLFCAALSF